MAEPDRTSPPTVAAPERLAALAAYGGGVLAPSAALDCLVRLAAEFCGTAMGLITLVDHARQLFIAGHGFSGGSEAPLESGFCPLVVETAAPVVIADTLADAAHASNVAAREGGMRFYAGAPLLTSDNHALGTLCVLDQEPRPGGLTPSQVEVLQALAAQVVTQFELRRSLARQEELLSAQQAASRTRDALAQVQAAVQRADGDLDAVLEALVGGAMQAVPAAKAGVLELIDGDELEYRQVAGTLVGHQGLRVPLDGSLAGHCVRRNTPMLVSDVREDPHVVRSLVEPLGLRSAVLAPIIRGERVLGVLKLQSSRPDAFGPGELDTLTLFAGAATTGLTEVRAAEAQRSASTSARRLQAVFDSATEVAIVVTDQDGRVTDWNTGAERTLGWTADEMRGETAKRFFTPEDRAAGHIETEMRLSLEHGRASDERWHLRKDGRRFWASGEMTPLRSDQGEAAGFVKVLRDRTSEHLAVEELRDSEARLHRAQETGGVGVFSIDPADDSLSPTPAFRALYGLPARERYATDDFAALVVDEDRPRLSTPDQRGLGVVPRDITYRIRRADTGDLRWIARRTEVERDASGRPVRIVGVARDVTEERLAGERRAALLTLSDRFAELTDTASLTDAACAALGVVLDVELVGYGLVDPDSETISVERDWTAGGAQSLAGVLKFRDYGAYINDLKRGETVVVTDARADPRTAAFAPALEARSARAFVNTPVFEHGVFTALLYVSTAHPRDWSLEELQFIREVAARTRAATARLEAESDRRRSEAELRLVADALPLLVAFVDRSLIYRFANDRYQEWFGKTPEEVVGRRIPDLAGPQGFDAREPAIRQALAGEPVRFDLSWPRPDGRRRVADIQYTPRRGRDGEVDGFYIFVQDVTAQRDAEALLTAQNVDLAREISTRTAERDRLWETTNDLMGTAGFDGYLKAVNPAWSVLLGWTDEELLGRPFFDIVDPADHAETVEVVQRLSSGKSVSGFIDHVLAKEGEARTIMWTAVPEPGTELFYIVGRDLTEQRQVEEALRQSQKMEAVGQLTGGLAHDFNNLLAGITGSLDLMSARLQQGRVNDVDKYMTAAQGAAKRAAALTHRLLAFSRRQTLDPKPTNVDTLVAGMTELIQRTVGPAIQVETVKTSGLWPTLVDPPQLENALLNLCINARDAMPDGGRITIETANKWLDSQAAAKHDVPEGQYLSLCVTDTGTGMSPDLISKIFDPFFTTKPLGQGTGLGLSMIYGFAKQSGGQVRVYSEVGQGTTMCLYLPRHYGNADPQTAELAAAAPPASQAGQTVLVVDDEPTVRMLVTDVLEDLGYAAIEAADSQSGLRVLQSDVRIDLLVTDVGLPGGMNGRQMADVGREVRPDLKVLFITGYAENAVLNNGYLSADMQVMTKPFSVDALARKVRELTND